jgi:hypothetical protein
MRKVLFPLALIGAMGVTAAVAQPPTREEIANVLKKIVLHGLCYAYFVDNGNALKSSGQEAQAIASYNSAWVFGSVIKSTIATAARGDIVGFSDSADALNYVETSYVKATKGEKKELAEACPKDAAALLRNVGASQRKLILAGAEERSKVFYKTKPDSLRSILEEAKKPK